MPPVGRRLLRAKVPELLAHSVGSLLVFVVKSGFHTLAFVVAFVIHILVSVSAARAAGSVLVFAAQSALYTRASVASVIAFGATPIRASAAKSAGRTHASARRTLVQRS